MNAIHTRCPRCATTFRASEEQLAAAGGRVRCGQCDEVFDARLHAVDLELADPAEPPPGLLNADYIDDLLRVTPVEPGPQPDADGSAEPGPAPVTPSVRIAEPGAPLVELPVEMATTAPRRFTRRALVRVALVAGVALALGAQYAWLSRERLAQDPKLRTHLESACATLGCRLPPYHDPASIRSTELLVRPDPAREGVLLVDAVLVNRAPFAQRYPDLELSFTDIEGRPVARRVFLPREYLGAHPAPDAQLAPREPVRVHLELKDPGEHATNYELRLIEPGDPAAGLGDEP
jgi:predicted Zn finger-like uncharacterized protein